MRQADTKSIRGLVIGALVMEASLLALHLARTPAAQVALVLLSYLVTGAVFAWLLWHLRHVDQHAASRGPITVLIVAGVLFRLTLLPLSPATSPDVNRYLWEGLVQLDGQSPYSHAPSAADLASLAGEHPDVWRAINHPDVAAIYPPTAQLLFLCNAALFGGSLLGWKLILLVFDGILAVGVGLALKDRSQSLLGLAGVLWCPLLLLESYEGGHLDLIGAALVVLAIGAIGRKRPILAGIALGLALNVKYLWPLTLLPLFAGYLRRPHRVAAFAASAAVTTAAVWTPYRAGFADAVATARLFAETWTFNDVIFEWLRGLPGPRWLAMVIVLAILAALAVVLASRRPRDLWRDAWLLTGAGLLLGPVAYPWYFIWVLPALALRPPIWLIVWILSIPALHLVDLHHVRTGEWDPMSWLWVVVGVVPAALLVRDWWRRLAVSRRTAPSQTARQSAEGPR